MKIYQIHQYSGAWEYFRDDIVGSYLKKERAEEEKTNAELKEKQMIEHGLRCIKCPFLEKYSDNINNLLSKYPDYCAEIELEEGKYGLNCKNYYAYWDESTFEIKEVEVEE